MRRAGTWIALMAVFIGTPACAQWKWRDAQGRVQYSDRPPPLGVPARDVLMRPSGRATDAVAATGAATGASAAPSAAASTTTATATSAPAGSGAASTPRTTDPELQARRRDAEAAALKAADDARARERADRCLRARDYLRTLEAGMSIARINEQGERIPLGDAERATEASRARDLIASDCR